MKLLALIVATNLVLTGAQAQTPGCIGLYCNGAVFSLIGSRKSDTLARRKNWKNRNNVPDVEWQARYYPNDCFCQGNNCIDGAPLSSKKKNPRQGECANRYEECCPGGAFINDINYNIPTTRKKKCHGQQAIEATDSRSVKKYASCS